tara:strand:+ start:25100 stop:25798 length:699 start_codon:yes stop_codon:yes gene_type:complete
MGNLMSSGRGKDKIFGDTSLKVIQEAVLLHKYGIEPENIETKQMDKGIFNEKSNIELAKRVLKWKEVDSDQIKVRLSNQYFIGEPDIITGDLLADIKTSWNASTFPWFKDPLNKSYKAQLHCYMDLTGVDQAELVYCLSNHPEHILQAEIKRMTYYYIDRPHLFNAESIEDLWSLAEIKAEQNVNKGGIFDQIPEEKRVKRFIIKKDPEFMKEIQDRVIEARKIFDELFKTI